jgi:adenine-specific DNA-methyltransferase
MPSPIRSVQDVVLALSARKSATIFAGDCQELIDALPADSVDLTISSPPYCIGKEYEKETLLQDFLARHRKILPALIRVTKPGGSLCWQIGSHATDQTLYPLDYVVFSILRDFPEMILRNRIIWTFGHGLHRSKSFSGRHEVILWFTKGNKYEFNLDAVRIPQKYPGKRHYKGEKRGEYSGNPKGKNPGDVWEIPNVKANHIEKTEHPCQFPIAIPQRLIRALCPQDGLVFDPFMGSAATGAAAISEGRRFLGAEVNRDYLKIAEKRIREAIAGTLLFRPEDRPIHVPKPTDAVAKRPEHFISKESHGYL